MSASSTRRSRVWPSFSQTLVRSLPTTTTGSPLRTLAATCSASKRKQLTSIQVVLPSPQPLLVLTRGVHASLNADTVPLPRISTSAPAQAVICPSASIGSSFRFLTLRLPHQDADPTSDRAIETKTVDDAARWSRPVDYSLGRRLTPRAEFAFAL